MSAVEFHTLQEESDTARLRYACAQVENAFLQDRRVLVWLDDATQLASFDNLLWTFGDRAFVPHETLADDPARCEAPVQLTCASPLPAAVFDAGFHTLLQLRTSAHESMLRFAQVIEVVDAEPGRRDAGRARFRFFRDHGAPPAHVSVAARN